MMLTHVCPNCKAEHEQPTTPEPDKLCQVCELVEKRIVDAVIPVRMWINNNVFTKEICVICKEMFKASMMLYEIPQGYICHDCADELNIKTSVPHDLILKAQERTFNMTFGDGVEKDGTEKTG